MDIKIWGWKQKAFTIPKLPRGTDGFLYSLSLCLEMIESEEDDTQTLSVPGSNNNMTLRDACTNMRPLKVVNKGQGLEKWRVTDEFGKYKNFELKEFVSCFFAAKVKYFSEALDFMKEPKSVQELKENAVEKYSMDWKSLNSIHDRLHWFQELGLVNHIRHKQKYVTTEDGWVLIEKIRPVTLEEIHDVEKDYTEDENILPITVERNKFLSFDWMDTDSRWNSISVSIGGIDNTLNALNQCLNLCTEETTTEELHNHYANYLNVKQQTVSNFLRFIKRLGLIELVGIKKYKITELGYYIKNIESQDLELSFIINRNYRYFFEILIVLSDYALSIKDIATIGHSKYGMETNSIDQSRHRVNYLMMADLVVNNGKKQYALTNRGRLLLNQLEYFCNFEENHERERSSIVEDKSTESVGLLDWMIKLRHASEDSQNPTVFEKEIKKVFEYLGFEAEHIGNSGNTDVVIKPKTISQFEYTVAVDTKTNNIGEVSTKAVIFDKIKRHRDKHKADYSLIIGKEFSGASLIEGAEANQVALLDINTLDELMKSHFEYPLHTVEYEALFKQTGLVTLDSLKEHYNTMERRKNLFRLIIHELVFALDDEKDELTSEVLYHLLKKETANTDDDYSIQEIEDMLNLLSNPLIDCVGSKANGNYFAKGGIEEAALKFGFYRNEFVRAKG